MYMHNHTNIVCNLIGFCNRINIDNIVSILFSNKHFQFHKQKFDRFWFKNYLGCCQERKKKYLSLYKILFGVPWRAKN